MTPRYIVIHHTAVSYDQNPDQWPATERYHKNKGWGTGGYNYEIAKDGSVHQFRKDGSATAAQYQNNMNDGRAISIALDGNFDIEEPTNEQCLAVWELMVQKMKKYPIPKENVLKHRDLAPKTCPGKLIPDDVYGYFRKRVGKEDQCSAWAQNAQEKLIEIGVTNGLRPYEPITREEAWVILHRLINYYNL